MFTLPSQLIKLNMHTRHKMCACVFTIELKTYLAKVVQGVQKPYFQTPSAILDQAGGEVLQAVQCCTR